MVKTKIGFPSSSVRQINNSQLRANLKAATSAIREKRARVVGEKEDWEELRRKGEHVRDEILNNLDSYLMQLERSVTAAGGIVHWARDSAEANQIILSLVQGHGETEVIKVKSLTTDELGLNEFLAQHEVTAFETDLAELIVQLAHDKPSHILVPAIHKNRSEIRDLFQRTIAQGRVLSNEPAELAETSRLYLRQKFLSSKIAISGVNFAVADTGTVCVVESEGNGRMCLTLPKVLISVMGIEKIVPGPDDLAIFLELLPRSSTGERMNPYTSLWTGVYPGDGPSEFHLVILDNGRSRVLADPIGRQALRCIRCSACLNVCPVYERSGGHAYDSVYPGPIGAILSPQLFGTESSLSLPWASTLCGACYEVCPVRINIPQVLVHLREKVISQGHRSRTEAMSFGLISFFFQTSRRFELLQNIATRFRVLINHLHVSKSAPGALGKWAEARELPQLPRETFRLWWRRNRDKNGK
ncbi:MAG: iron-sulfur cluster-binding protein [Acidimicrobiaceae bacterium]|nr:iron-sulfur cluster-binding protein [Acidimicrobiaceae bacterium]